MYALEGMAISLSMIDGLNMTVKKTSFRLARALQPNELVNPGLGDEGQLSIMRAQL